MAQFRLIRQNDGDATVEGYRLVQIGHVQMYVTDARQRGEALPGAVTTVQFSQQAIDVQRLGRHPQLTIELRPFPAWPVGVDLDAVAVGIGEVEGFTDQVV